MLTWAKHVVEFVFESTVRVISASSSSFGFREDVAVHPAVIIVVVVALDEGGPIVIRLS